MRFINNGNSCISLVNPADVVQCLRLALEKDNENDVFDAGSVVCSVKELLNEITNQMEIEPIKNAFHISLLI